MSLSADDMILYTENLKDATRKLLELITEFSKVARYKINTKICINQRWTIKRGNKETIPFTMAPKRIKYLGINLPKETKTCTLKTRKCSWKNWRRHKQMERHTMFMDWKNLQTQCNSYQITNSIFHWTRTKKS